MGVRLWTLALAIGGSACVVVKVPPSPTDTDVTDPVDTDALDTDLPDTDAADTDAADTDVVDPVARGEYLVEHVVGCDYCHTPRNEDGSLDETQAFGGRYFTELDDSLGGGSLYSANLTSHVTGLGTWTDEEIKAALTEGHDKDGRILDAIMPYWLFTYFTPADLDAVVAYLRTLPPVDNELPAANENRTTALAPYDDAWIPRSTLPVGDPDHAAAEHGRYLVIVSGCIECHSPDRAFDPNDYPVDTTLTLAGGRTFAGYDGPGGTSLDTLRATNLTPSENGILGWTPQQVADALRVGGDDVCAPMPSGPDGPYGGITERDALDIGVYLTTLPPVASEVFPECVVTP